jgi:hypothetical protein
MKSCPNDRQEDQYGEPHQTTADYSVSQGLEPVKDHMTQHSIWLVLNQTKPQHFRLTSLETEMVLVT